MPMEEYFSKALYTFDIGQNDLGDEGIFRNMTVQELNASVPDIITGFSTNIKVMISIINHSKKSLLIYPTIRFLLLKAMCLV